MRTRIVFNVGGTKYETSVSTIETFPDTLLGMLLRRHLEKVQQEQEVGELEEIFLDRDGSMFRWILHW